MSLTDLSYEQIHNVDSTSGASVGAFDCYYVDNDIIQ
jgi:hypothetical protein